LKTRRSGGRRRERAGGRWHSCARSDGARSGAGKAVVPAAAPEGHQDSRPGGAPKRRTNLPYDERSLKKARARSRPCAPSLAARSLKLRPARRLLRQSARGWRSRAYQGRPYAASAVTIRRSFAEDFVLGGGASLAAKTKGPRTGRRRHLNEDRVLARRVRPARTPCARRDQHAHLHSVHSLTFVVVRIGETVREFSYLSEHGMCTGRSQPESFIRKKKVAQGAIESVLFLLPLHWIRRKAHLHSSQSLGFARERFQELRTLRVAEGITQRHEQCHDPSETRTVFRKTYLS